MDKQYRPISNASYEAGWSVYTAYCSVGTSTYIYGKILNGICSYAWENVRSEYLVL